MAQKRAAANRTALILVAVVVVVAVVAFLLYQGTIGQVVSAPVGGFLTVDGPGIVTDRTTAGFATTTQDMPVRHDAISGAPRRLSVQGPDNAVFFFQIQTGTQVPRVVGFKITAAGTYTLSLPAGTVFRRYSIATSSGTITIRLTTGQVIVTFTPTAPIIVPAILTLSPTSGKVGDTITITGTGFVVGATNVKFGNTPAQSAVTSSTSITATVPSVLPAGPTSVTVTTPGGTATSAGVFTVTVPQTPPPTPTPTPTPTAATEITTFQVRQMSIDLPNKKRPLTPETVTLEKGTYLLYCDNPITCREAVKVTLVNGEGAFVSNGQKHYSLTPGGTVTLPIKGSIVIGAIASGANIKYEFSGVTPDRSSYSDCTSFFGYLTSLGSNPCAGSCPSGEECSGCECITHREALLKALPGYTFTGSLLR